MDPQTSEIIALLYESTQAPQHPLEPPALNPTGGVKVKPPTEGLTFRKDPTRPGGGVFVAHEKPNEEVVRDLPEGLIVQEAHMEGEITFEIPARLLPQNSDVRQFRVLTFYASATVPAATAADKILGEPHPP